MRKGIFIGFYFITLILSSQAFPQMLLPCKDSVLSSHLDLKIFSDVTSFIFHDDLKQKIASTPKIFVENIIEHKTEPSFVTCSSVSYKFKETALEKNDAIYFHVPVELQERAIRFMVIGHRQNPTSTNTEWDESPGLTSVQVRSTEGDWNYWGGPSSGEYGAKFAEPRHVPEMENLYEWNKLGHISVQTNEAKFNELKVDSMKMVSVGPERVFASEMTLKVSPPKISDSSQFIYSPGTEFTIVDGVLRETKLGGGQSFKGKFPGAKELYGTKILEFDLKNNKKLSSIDIACGDSHPDEVKNSDGGVGTQGWAKISVGIKYPSGKIEWILSRENVPPEGIVSASPLTCNDLYPEGSKLVIKGESDRLYIMGVNIAYQ